jgi:hypothetical protein
VRQAAGTLLLLMQEVNDVRAKKVQMKIRLVWKFGGSLHSSFRKRLFHETN